MRYLLYDTETTGLSSKPGMNEIVQLGGVFLDGRKELGVFDYSVQPSRWDKVNSDALKVNNLSRAMLESFEQPSTVFDSFYNDVMKYSGGYKYVLIGQNISFDRRFLHSWWDQWKKPHHKEFDDVFHDKSLDLDMVVISKALVAANIIDVPNVKLGTIAEALNIKPTGNLHNAYVDADVTKRCLFYMIDHINNIRRHEPTAVADLKIDRFLDELGLV